MPRRFTGVAARIARRRTFRRAGRRVVPAVDRVLHRLSRGRVHLSDLGIPTLLLVVAGHRSGELRRTPLAYVPDDGTWLVVGSNWGQDHHPAWTANLLAADTARVEAGGRTAIVRPVLLEGAARDAAWATVVAAWPVYEDYQQSVPQRTLRVFRLVPVEDES